MLKGLLSMVTSHGVGTILLRIFALCEYYSKKIRQKRGFSSEQKVIRETFFEGGGLKAKMEKEKR